MAHGIWPVARKGGLPWRRSWKCETSRKCMREGRLDPGVAGVSLSAEKGDFVGIMGASGSGKTTLLNCIATIDAPTSGTVLINGKT